VSEVRDAMISAVGEEIARLRTTIALIGEAYILLSLAHSPDSVEGPLREIAKELKELTYV
jgi:hypothetical protein